MRRARDRPVTVRQIAQRVIFLHRGVIVEAGLTDVLDRSREAYARRLVASMPQLDGSWRPDEASLGAPPA